MKGGDVGARIRGVSDREGGIVVRVTLAVARRAFKKLIGRNEVPAPFRLFAHNSRLLVAYGQLEQALTKADSKTFDLRELARARVSTLVGCAW